VEFGLHCTGFRQTEICPEMLQDMGIFYTEFYANLPQKYEDYWQKFIWGFFLVAFDLAVVSDEMLELGMRNLVCGETV
jgi:hypothetical protein